eukprot:11075315-Alexandrium_andersonii.AAC.1
MFEICRTYGAVAARNPNFPQNPEALFGSPTLSAVRPTPVCRSRGWPRAKVPRGSTLSVWAA